MLTLRIFGLMSNIAFILYAVLSGLEPILLLHLMLFPINLFHLWDLLAHDADEHFPQAERWSAEPAETAEQVRPGAMGNFSPDAEKGVSEVP